MLNVVTSQIVIHSTPQHFVHWKHAHRPFVARKGAFRPMDFRTSVQGAFLSFALLAFAPLSVVMHAPLALLSPLLVLVGTQYNASEL